MYSFNLKKYKNMNINEGRVFIKENRFKILLNKKEQLVNKLFQNSIFRKHLLLHSICYSDLPVLVKRNTFEKGVIGLSTKLPKVYRGEDLTPLFIKGIKKQPIPLINKYLNYLGIQPKWIKYILFLKKNILMLLILKKNFKKIKSIFQCIPYFEILENFSPIELYGREKANNQITKNLELAYFNKVQKIMMKNVPLCVKEYFHSSLIHLNFKTIHRDGSPLLEEDEMVAEEEKEEYGKVIEEEEDKVVLEEEEEEEEEDDDDDEEDEEDDDDEVVVLEEQVKDDDDEKVIVDEKNKKNQNLFIDLTYETDSEIISSTSLSDDDESVNIFYKNFIK